MENSFDVISLAKELGVSQSTVKKYYLLMEENEYRFTRDYKGRVIFTQKDFSIFTRLLKLKNEPGMNLKKAVKHIINEEQTNRISLEKEVEKQFESLQNYLDEKFNDLNRGLDKLNERTKVLNKTNERSEGVKMSSEEVLQVIESMDTEEKWKLLHELYYRHYNTSNHPRVELNLDY